MRVVIDTNVLVSAALKDRDPEAVVLFVAGHPEFEWIASLTLSLPVAYSFLQISQDDPVMRAIR